MSVTTSDGGGGGASSRNGGSTDIRVHTDSQPMHLRVPRSLKEQLVRIADADHRTLNNLCVTLLLRALRVRDQERRAVGL